MKGKQQARRRSAEERKGRTDGMDRSKKDVEEGRSIHLGLLEIVLCVKLDHSVDPASCRVLPQFVFNSFARVCFENFELRAIEVVAEPWFVARRLPHRKSNTGC